VEPDFAQALGEHRSATGTGSSETIADPGPVTADHGWLVYGVSLSNGLVGVASPSGWRPVSVLSDGAMKSDAEIIAPTDSGPTDPQWTWMYTEPHTWLATSLVLKPAPGQALVLDGTLNESGSTLGQGFYPTNPNLGDAIIATFMWKGPTNNVIASVTDRLSSGTSVGNTYDLVEYVTNGDVSMATYVATNVQNFPETTPGNHDALVVEANLSEPVVDGGALLSSYSGVKTSLVQALGDHHSAGDSASDVTTVDPGEIAVQPGALVYAVTLSDGMVGLERPSDLNNITTMSDDSLKGDGEYLISTSTTATTARPQWTWYFNSTSRWVATALSLNPK
jgi:hypothetical protein